jgi:hypothetical protein
MPFTVEDLIVAADLFLGPFLALASLAFVTYAICCVVKDRRDRR